MVIDLQTLLIHEMLVDVRVILIVILSIGNQIIVIDSERCLILVNVAAWRMVLVCRLFPIGSTVRFGRESH